MDFGGIVIIAAAFTLFGTIPLLVARRTAMMETREGDRYSQRLRLLDDTCARSGSECERSSGALLAVRRVHPEATGGDMADQSLNHREVRVERRAVESVHEIARLRARRAARLSVEAAAGRRRLLVSAVLALATAVVGIVAALTALAWYWTLIPGALLALALTASRLAAVRSHKADAAELELLAELREHAGRAPARRPRPAGHESPGASGAGTSTEAALEDPAPLETPALGDGAPRAEEPAAIDGTDAVEDPLAASASVERRTWSVASVPAPTYAMRGRVAGRAVHSDTDLRGIPRVEALVPARPLAVSEMKAARSTADVASDAGFAFDLDAVLEARRAQ